MLVLIGVGFSLVTGRAPPPWQKPTLESGEIRAIDARGLDILWIDARTEKAYAEAHIPNAIWLNPEDPDAELMHITVAWLENPNRLFYTVLAQPVARVRSLPTGCAINSQTLKFIA